MSHSVQVKMPKQKTTWLKENNHEMQSLTFPINGEVRLVWATTDSKRVHSLPIYSMWHSRKPRWLCIDTTTLVISTGHLRPPADWFRLVGVCRSLPVEVLKLNPIFWPTESTRVFRCVQQMWNMNYWQQRWYWLAWGLVSWRMKWQLKFDA